jgi:hypothetical protein
LGIAENEKRSRSLFENFMQEHGVPRAGNAKVLSSGWANSQASSIVSSPII